MLTALMSHSLPALVLAGANLLTNPSFESGPAVGSFITLPGGSTAIVGWTVLGTSIDLKASYWQQTDGSRSLDLDGTPGPGGVSQTFVTTPGQWYEVSLMMAGNPVCQPQGLKKLTISAAGQSATLSFDTTGRTVSAMGWSPRSWCFLANASTTTLKFMSQSAGGNCGPVIDAVVVAPFDPAIVADLNCDDKVNQLDLATLLGAWGTCEVCGACVGDLDGDCVVGSIDLAILLGSWFE
jgi:choice-of-anchor C domain-containing protein